MAPEMIRHEPYTGKADVFSWGVLLAEVLSQRPPYEGLYMTPVQVPCTFLSPNPSHASLKACPRPESLLPAPAWRASLHAPACSQCPTLFASMAESLW